MVRRERGSSVDHHYLHRDHLGSITAVTDEASGQVVERYSYDAWGKRRTATNWQAADITTALNYRGYTGHEHLDDVGIIHMNGRIYLPKLGKMMSPDPITQSPENGQNYSRYSYVENNPLRYTDPSGYEKVDKPQCRDTCKSEGVSEVVVNGYQDYMEYLRERNREFATETARNDWFSNSRTRSGREREERPKKAPGDKADEESSSDDDPFRCNDPASPPCTRVKGNLDAEESSNNRFDLYELHMAGRGGSSYVGHTKFENYTDEELKDAAAGKNGESVETREKAKTTQKWRKRRNQNKQRRKQRYRVLIPGGLYVPNTVDSWCRQSPEECVDIFVREG